MKKNTDKGLPASKAMFFLALIIIVTACDQRLEQTEKPVITVSIMPQKFFVEKIAHDKFHINVMIPPGSNHENYDPTPRQIAELDRSFIYFRIGSIEFENTWIAKFKDIYPELRIVDLSLNLELIENAGENHHGHNEPHTWMSPVNVKIMAKDICENLAQNDLKNAGFYRFNYKAFVAEIDSINNIIGLKLNDLKSRSFIIYHPALTYFARDFGLHQYPLEIEGKSPSPYIIAQLIELSKKENIKTVVVQKQFDQSKAQMIADETGGKIITIDPTEYLWSDQIVEIAEKLSKALNN
ncbi:MAG: cation ABC transporter substrate-binding protein [Bacteroidetes bacterium]|nr:cation ABC transporter substrate-binding protein [Bacteroidota bacterium]